MAPLAGGISLQLRITLWVVLITAVVTAVSVLVLLLYQRQSGRNTFERSLLEQVDRAEARLAKQFQSESENGTGPDWPALARAEGMGFVVLNTETGDVVPIAPERDDTEIDDILARITPDDLILLPVRLPGEGVWLIGRSLKGPHGEGLTMLAVGDPAFLGEELWRITLLLLVMAVVSITASGIAAWLVGGVAVRPLQHLEAYAAELSPDTLDARIPLQNEGSEASALQDELRGAMQRIEKAYEEQGRFLANISHELKTPVSVVQAEADVLAMTDAGLDKHRAFSKSTADEMRRLGAMIESFLLLTRVQQGESRIGLTTVSMNDIVMETFEDSRAMADLHEVRIEPSLVLDGPDPIVQGNEELLRTAAGNMLRNAIRFSPKGVAVDLVCCVDGKYAKLLVRDRGVGVPEELLPRIFEPFTQASEERRRGRGTGLGLQIAKGIAEIHKGDISVENMDVGCMFTLSLPLGEPTVGPHPAK